MKSLILMGYMLGGAALYVYLYSMLGAVGKVGTMSQDELNAMEEKKDELNEKDAAGVRTLSKIAFVLFGGYLHGVLGVVFGLGTKELVGDSSMAWVGYMLWSFIMIFVFKAGSRSVEETYELNYPLKKVLFWIAMFGLYLVAIWKPIWLPGLFTWYWIY